MISMIVPAYNEEHNIEKTVEELKKVLGKMEDYEIIVVNDGSTDNTRAVLSRIKGIKVISYPINRGKGYALRQGISRSKGEIVGYIDGDGEISPEFIPSFYEEIKSGASDIAIGKKQNLKNGVLRKSYSLGFRLICWILFGIYSDTQTGLKMFNQRIKSLSVQNDSYIFDLELVMACKGRNLKIKEIPVTLSNGGKRNRIGVRQVMQIMLDLINLKLWRQSCANQQSYGYY